MVAAFGMGDQQTMAGAVEVFDPDVRGFRQTEARAIDGHEKGLGAKVAGGADGQEPFDLGHAVRTGHAPGTFGALDLAQERFDVAFEQPAVEGAQRVDGDLPAGRQVLTVEGASLRSAIRW